jgi:hypothetical protein
MASAVRRLGSLSMARGCARIDAGPDTAKIGSADRVQVHHARLIAVIGVRKTYPHGLDPKETLQDHDRSRSPWTTTRHFESRRSIQWATAAEFLSLRSSSRDEFTIPSVP